MKYKNKVLMIGPLPPPFSGQSVAFKMLSDHFKKKIKVEILNFSSIKDLPGQNISPYRLLEYIIFFSKFFKKIILYKYNFIYLTISQSKRGFFRDFILINFSKFFNLKIILHLKGGNYHNFYNSVNFILKKLIILTLNQSTNIVILGKSLLNNFKFCPNLKNKIRIIHNCPEKNIKFKDKKKNKKIKIIFLSNLIKSKGYFTLLKSLKILKDKKINFTCEFYGNFYADPNLKQDDLSLNKNIFFDYIKKNKLENFVTYKKNISGKLKYKKLYASDIFVLPTIYKYEGQPISIIEAMACSNLIITTKFRSIVDIVEENYNAKFIKFNDHKKLSSYLIFFSKNRYILKKYQLNSFYLYEKKLNRKTHFNLFDKIFNNSLNVS